MKNKLHIQFSPTRLKQIKKIALSGSRAKLKILNGKLEEGFYLLKSTAKKLQSFATDLGDRIPQALASRISLDLFSHFERKSSKRLGIPKGIVLGGVLALMASLPAAGQDIFVTNTTDENDGLAPKSLREAIIEANLSGIGNRILLPNGSSHLLTIGNLPTIVATGTGGTLQIICTGTTNAMISGGNSFRPLTMAIGSDLMISKITITSGTASEGGGIYNNGNLIVSNCLITNNAATGVFPNGSGGGIHNSGNGSAISVLIQNSTISGNTALFGAGISNSDNSSLTISSSSISGNISSSQGGGIFNGQSDLIIRASSFTTNQSSNVGGGLRITGSVGGGQNVLIQNTTISGNIAGSSGGGIYHRNLGGVNNITLQHVTMSNNSGVGTGGFVNTGGSNITMQNTIIANSTGSDFALGGGAINTTSTSNIVETGLVHSSVTAVDPLLGALTLSTGFLVHTPLTGSPSLSAGANIGVLFDQLGAARGGSCVDIGAVEVPSPIACMVVSTPTGVTNTWIGCTSDDWGTASNWSANCVPIDSDIVYIPISAANQLIIDEVATCAKLIVQIGAKCIVDYNAGGKLVVKF